MTALGSFEVDSIVCGDCLDMLERLPNECVDLVVTDPPYNIGKDYGPGVDDTRSEEDYLSWYSMVAAEVYRVHAGGYVYVSCSASQIWTLRPVWEQAGFSFQMMLIWHGPNRASKGSRIRRQWQLLYEPIFMLLKGTRQPMLNEVAGFNSDAVLRYPRPQRNFTGDLRRTHPTEKPVRLYANIIARTPGNIVADFFLGSGASLVAAKRLGRHYFGCDINAKYIQTAQARLGVTQRMFPRAERRTSRRVVETLLLFAKGLS